MRENKKNMQKKAVSILLFALCVLPALSWDFCQKNKDGVMLYYNFYDDDFQMGILML